MENNLPPPPTSTFEHPWSREHFRANAHAAVDFIVSYLERLEQEEPSPPPWPVTSQVEPGYLRPRLPASAPERPDDDGESSGGGASSTHTSDTNTNTNTSDPERAFASFLGDVENHVLPGLTHWQSPNFFSFFPANSSLPGIVGEMLASALNVIGFSWAASPASTELEGVLLDWLARALGLPEQFMSPEASSGSSSSSAESMGGGCIQSTASDAALVALLAARARVLSPQTREGDDDDAASKPSASSPRPPPPPPAPGAHNEDADGLSRLTVYASEQAHCCVRKACMVAGIPFSRAREIRSDRGGEGGGGGTFEIDAAALRAALEEDFERGLVPCLVVATVGTTPTCAVDDLGAVSAAVDAACEAAREKRKREERENKDGKEEGKARQRRPVRRPWIHVDAAYAGVSALCPEYRDVFDGAERVDSLSTNFHKWGLTNFDCACFWVQDSSWLHAALSLTPSYLVARNNDRDFRDWQVPLGRRFRSLKLWLVLRTYGLEKLREYVRRHCELASWFAGRVQESEDGLFELAAPPRLGLVCFRLKAASSAGGGKAALEASSKKTAALVERVNARGRISLTSTTLLVGKKGEKDGESSCCIARLAIGGTNTAGRHVELAWRELVEVARGLLEEEEEA